MPHILTGPLLLDTTNVLYECSYTAKERNSQVLVAVFPIHDKDHSILSCPFPLNTQRRGETIEVVMEEDKIREWEREKEEESMKTGREEG